MSFPLLKCWCKPWKKLPNLISSNCQLKLFHSGLPLSKKTIYKGKEAKKIRSFVLTRYVDYVKSYETVLESKFPAAMRVYRIFMEGIKDFYGDIKMFLRLAKKINLEPGGMGNLSRKEIELYYQLPKDMIRVAPVLLISALPFANYVIFPLAYMFPRVMLCSHFWTLQQKSEFAVINLRNRLLHQRPVFRHMQEAHGEINDERLHEKWSRVLALLGSGQQPTVRQVVECNKLFTEKPYHIYELRGAHVVMHPFSLRSEPTSTFTELIIE